MPQTIETNKVNAIARALSLQAYHDKSVRLVDDNISGYSHIVATRNGLFAANECGTKRLCFGMFFGLVARSDSLYVFESCDIPRSPSQLGRIVKFEKTENRLSKPRVIVENLDNGCHQMDVINDQLILLDTYNQKIRAFSLSGQSLEINQPLPFSRTNDWAGGYRHMNAVLQVGNAVFLMMHNGANATGRLSEIMICDLEWTQSSEVQLPGHGCHDFALLENNTVLSCNSMSGELISSSGARVKISDMMTRGLSVGDHTVVVGSTQLVHRDDRTSAKGRLNFLTSELEPIGEIDIEAGPTDICRLDCQDSSLSEYASSLPSKPIDIENFAWLSD